MYSPADRQARTAAKPRPMSIHSLRRRGAFHLPCTDAENPIKRGRCSYHSSGHASSVKKARAAAVARAVFRARALIDRTNKAASIRPRSPSEGRKYPTDGRLRISAPPARSDATRRRSSRASAQPARSARAEAETAFSIPCGSIAAIPPTCSGRGSRMSGKLSWSVNALPSHSAARGAWQVTTQHQHNRLCRT